MRQPCLYLILLFVFANSAFSQLSFEKLYPVSGAYGSKLNIVRMGDKIIAAAGDNGLLLTSTNEGLSWNQIQTGFQRRINNTSIGYYGSYMLFCSGGYIIKSTNSGLNWSSVYTGFDCDLYGTAGVYTAGGEVAFATGTGGHLLVSSNSGLNWTKLESQTTYSLYDAKSVSAYSGSYVYACGESGTVLRTRVSYNYPQTISITKVNVNNYTNLYSVAMTDSFTVVAVGDYGSIFRSTNGGVNWTKLYSPVNGKLNCVNRLAAKYNMYICGDGGIMLKSTDNGLSWQKISSGVNVNLTSFCGDLINNYSVSTDGQIFKTTRVPNLEGLNNRLQTPFESGRIKTFLQSSGIFDQDLRTNNTPGFCWPKDSTRYAVFTAGLTLGAKYNGELRTASASYVGEFTFGSVNNETPSGYPYFMMFSVKRGDNCLNNIWWANWDKMVPFGAPYTDVNNNGVYDPCIDTPGVKNAYQTIFMALTDGFAYTHYQSEGFAGGTLPLYSDLRLTAWTYDNDSLADAQFFKYTFINKSNVMWDSVHFCLFVDPDLGSPDDDYIGCDAERNMSYCYNADNMDGIGLPYYYGVDPPAVGFRFLQTPVIRNVQPPVTIGMSSFCYHNKNISYTCEREPGESHRAFNFMKGLKSDGSSWLDASLTPPARTMYNFSGDPETNSGWTERKGSIHNCGGDTTGFVEAPRPPGDRRFFMNSGSGKLQMYPGEVQTIVLAQMIKRGANNLNSVTKLKEYSDYIESFYSTIDRRQVIPFIPETYQLYQNYPNPFNAITKIKYELNFATNVKLIVFDILGRKVATLVNQYQNPGLNVVTFDGSSFASGVYFYRLETDRFTDIKKMVLVK